jgi:hypothetical protein
MEHQEDIAMYDWIASGEGTIFVDGFASVKWNVNITTPNINNYRPTIALRLPYPPTIDVKLTEGKMLTIGLEVG